MDLQARKCEYKKCGKPLGVFSFCYSTSDGTKAGYFHPSCFAKFKSEKGKIDD